MRIRIPGSLVFVALVAATIVICVFVEPPGASRSASDSTAYHILVGHPKECWACAAIEKARQQMTPEGAAEIARATQAHADVSEGVGRPMPVSLKALCKLTGCPVPSSCPQAGRSGNVER